MDNFVKKQQIYNLFSFLRKLYAIIKKILDSLWFIRRKKVSLLRLTYVFFEKKVLYFFLTMY